LTPGGLALGERLARSIHGEVVFAQHAARQTMEELFQAGRPLVCIMALGIVVRILGPLARDKKTDAPVVVVDEAGRFAISVLGGHEGGANALAKEVAKVLGALAVITTASDALGLPAVDLIGREWGWRIEGEGEGRDNLTKVAAAVVRGEPIGVYQDAGRADWWQVFGEWPSSFHRIESWPPTGSWPGLLAISDRWLARLDECPVVVFRPPSLVLGTGCRRGVPVEEFEALFKELCQTRGFAPLSLGIVATVSLKANEPGLLEFAARHGVPVVSYAPEELAQVASLPTPSEKVRAKIGMPGVAEPAAMLAAGATSLLLPKHRGQRLTMALARREA